MTCPPWRAGRRRGLGDFAIVQGYQRFNWQVTIVSTVIIIALVQAAQFFGNYLARKALRR